MNNICRILLVFLPIILAFSFSIESRAKEEDTFLSETAVKACEKYGEEYGICPELLMAIAETESGGDPGAKNGSCKGIMQISERWHKDRMERLGVTDIYDTAGNILVAADYLYELFESNEDAGAVLMIYNGDSGVKKYTNGECDVSEYAEKILKRSEELERLHGK